VAVPADRHPTFAGHSLYLVRVGVVELGKRKAPENFEPMTGLREGLDLTQAGYVAGGRLG
jgi:hypothetical protein